MIPKINDSKEKSRYFNVIQSLTFPEKTNWDQLFCKYGITPQKLYQEVVRNLDNVDNFNSIIDYINNNGQLDE